MLARGALIAPVLAVATIVFGGICAAAASPTAAPLDDQPLNTRKLGVEATAKAGLRLWRRRHAQRGRRVERAAAAQRVNETRAPAAPMDTRCHAREHTGYAGDGAVVWGLSYHLRNAGECCGACKAHAAMCGQPGARGKAWWPARPDLKCGGGPNVCQIWSFCPLDRCFSLDVHKHRFGECWLKFQREGMPHAPKDPHSGHTSWPEAMRRAPRRTWPWAVREDIWPGPMPEHVSWTSGVLAEPGAQITSAPPGDKWRERWCRKHGPC